MKRVIAPDGGKKGKKLNCVYHKLLFVFFLNDGAVVVAGSGGLVGKVEAVLALAAVAASTEAQSRDVDALYRKEDDEIYI